MQGDGDGRTYSELGTAIGTLVQEKNIAYGDSAHRTGQILRILYPDGVEPDQYTDMLLVVRILDKLSRIAHGNAGAFEEDAWKDIAGYGLLGSRRSL